MDYEGQLETLAETDAEAVSDVDPDPAEDSLAALESDVDKLAEIVELFAGASSSSCGEIAPKDEVVKEELDAEPVHDAPLMSAEGAKAATALVGSESKPVDPRLIKVKSEATEAVGHGIATMKGKVCGDDSGAAKGQDAVGHVEAQVPQRLLASELAHLLGDTSALHLCGDDATPPPGCDSGAAKGQAAGSTDKGKGQGKEKRQRGERRGKWSGWNTVKRFLENHPTSREPLRQFLRDYHQGHDAAGPTPSSGYPELNDSHTRSNTINFYKRQDW